MFYSDYCYDPMSILFMPNTSYFLAKILITIAYCIATKCHCSNNAMTCGDVTMPIVDVTIPFVVWAGAVRITKGAPVANYKVNKLICYLYICDD